MSTLAESPSPAQSPRSSAPSFDRAYAVSRRTPSRSPHPPASNAPAARSHAPTTAPLPKQAPSETPRDQLPVALAPGSHYADAGTQYSPEGSPPTSHRGMVESSALPLARQKRKEPFTAIDTDMSPPSAAVLPQSPAAKSTTKSESSHPDSSPANALTARLERQLDVSSVTDIQPVASKRARTGSQIVKIMPRKYETCDAKDLGVLIANMLMELIRLNDQIPLRDGRLTRFHSRAPPGISCHDYLHRLIQHATLSPPILLSMVYYIDRLCALYPAFTISSLTVHRFLITSATVAAKGLSDSFWTNPTYARIGGISTSELATLEMEFLQRVQWRIVPKPEVLVDYYISLVDRNDGYELEAISLEQEVKMEDNQP